MASIPARAGPWKGVRNTTEPGDDSENILASLVNGYIPDPEQGSAAQARPGAVPLNGTTLNSGAFIQRNYCHVADDGTVTNFVFAGGKVYRVSGSSLETYTDVTPSNVIIHTTNRIFCTSLNGQIFVNDDSNTPWLMSSLTSTPVVGTNVAYGTTITLTDTTIYFQFTGTVLHNGTYTTFTSTQTAPSGTVAANKWGVFRFSITSAGVPVVVTAGADNATGYNSAALALAAAPNVPAGSYDCGICVLDNSAAGAFTGGASNITVGGGTPRTPTYYERSSGWQGFGQPVVYVGAIHLIVRKGTPYGGSLTATQTTFAWSEPNDPDTGYQQQNYDNAWTITQTGNTPIYALAAVNDNLYISRDLSWTSVSGSPGVNFESQATRDTVSYNVGCVAPDSVQVVGNFIYFQDAIGRPYRFPIGGVPEPLWLQMRTPYETAAANGYATASNVSTYAFTVVEPNLNLVLMACWPSAASTRPNVLHVFDALTGRYEGEWNIGGSQLLDSGGIWRDANNTPLLVIGGNKSAAAGFEWKIARRSENVWQDNSANITVTPQSHRLGFHAQYQSFVSEVRVVTGADTPMTGSLLASNGIYALSSQTSAGVTLLSRGSTDTAVASTAFDYQLLGVSYSKAAVAAGTALAAGTIPANTWAAYRFSINSAGTIACTAGAANTSTGYSTLALAEAAMPATPVGSWNMGAVTLKTKTGQTFIAGTDALFGGSSGNVASETTYYAGEFSFDGTYRTMFKPDSVVGRGVQVSVSPTTTLAPWSLYSIEVDLVPSKSAVDSR